MWYENARIYHVYAMAFEGHGGFSEIKKWIPHIKSMGLNAVLLSPVLESISHGYDVTDYFQADKRLGTNQDLKNLVQEFHNNGIKVIFDSVFNHCGREFAKFQELKKGNRNLASWFSGVDFSRKSPLGDDFTYDTWSGYFELVKFNLNNPEVVNYLLDAAKFWIDEFDIDGMRLDAANVLNFDFMKSLRQVTSAKKQDFWLMGEVVTGDYSKYCSDEALHSVTNYILYKGLFSSINENNLYELAYTIDHQTPNHGNYLYTFIDNHDQPRIASLTNKPEFLEILYSLLFTLPGIPSIYYGSEWGIKGVKDKNSDAPLRPYINIAHPPIKKDLTKSIKNLAKLREEHPALVYGDYKRTYLEYRKPFVFERTYKTDKVIVGVNISDKSEEIKGLGIIKPNSVLIKSYSVKP